MDVPEPRIIKAKDCRRIHNLRRTIQEGELDKLLAGYDKFIKWHVAGRPGDNKLEGLAE